MLIFRSGWLTHSIKRQPVLAYRVSLWLKFGSENAFNNRRRDYPPMLWNSRPDCILLRTKSQSVGVSAWWRFILATVLMTCSCCANHSITEKLLAAVSKLLLTCEELKEVDWIQHREHLCKAYIEPLVKSVWLELVIPGKPKSCFLKYQTTDEGYTWLTEWWGHWYYKE